MSSSKRTCIEINHATADRDDRVEIISDEKPECQCEVETFSEYSPGLIQANETIVRMVCVPMHVHLKRMELKTSFFSHMASFGASVQRLENASDGELVACVEDIVGPKEDRVWLGFVEARANDIRELAKRESRQTFCVADAGLENNPAHAEIHAAWKIPDADQIEYRVALRDLFVKQGVHNRRSLRSGAIWSVVKAEIQSRPLPEAWSSMA